MVSHSDRKHHNQRLLAIVIVSSLYTSSKRGEIKTVSVLERLPCSLVTGRSLDWLNGRGREIILMKIAGMVVRKNREVKNCWGIGERSVSGDCEDDSRKQVRVEKGVEK